MATFVALIDWTEQGVKGFRESVDRYEASRSSFELMGVRLTQVYWTLGGHDIVAVAEADDEETMAAATLMLAAEGNVRTTTMRAFSADEMRAVIARTG
ncbi:MAG TPA: GYD domain-containing protein [Solirubrobacteraceae bacterium]|nr:GYD domain-containing protein [Solirubrobacteraceae bacterium]